MPGSIPQRAGVRRPVPVSWIGTTTVGPHTGIGCRVPADRVTNLTEHHIQNLPESSALDRSSPPSGIAALVLPAVLTGLAGCLLSTHRAARTLTAETLPEA